MIKKGRKYMTKSMANAKNIVAYEPIQTIIINKVLNVNDIIYLNNLSFFPMFYFCCILPKPSRMNCLHLKVS